MNPPKYWAGLGDVPGLVDWYEDVPYRVERWERRIHLAFHGRWDLRWDERRGVLRGSLATARACPLLSDEILSTVLSGVVAYWKVGRRFAAQHG
jgi:hypothetical protein